MKNDPLLISFGGVVVGFSGDLPDPGEQVLLFAQPEAVPDVKVRITETDALPKPQGAELLYTATGLKMFGRETKRWALYSNPNRADGPDHAALCYDTDAPDDLELCFDSRKMALNIQSVLSSIMLETLLLRHGRGVLHASYIRLPNERSRLFSAPSGTGKSTQAELWRRYRNAQIINGDKAIVYLASEGVSVSSLPLCGSSGICRNVSGPVQAIVTLSQSRENRICRLGGKDAVKALLSQLYVQRGEAEAVAGALALASGIAGRVPVFHLSCLPEVSAVECLEKAMKEAQCDAG